MKQIHGQSNREIGSHIKGYSNSYSKETYLILNYVSETISFWNTFHL